MKRSLLTLLSLGYLPWMLSCAKIEFGDGPGVGPDDNPPVGTVDEAAGFYVRARTGVSQVYYTHKNEADFNQPCVADEGESITCIVEGEELDLFHSGVSLQHNAPGTMCHYLARTPYYYYKYQTGAGPAVVQIDTDSLGAVGTDTDNDGLINQPVATCTFDHTASRGPNCCLGNYAKVERRWNGVTYDIVGSDPAVAWGGTEGACLGGAGLFGWPLDISGFPRTLVSYVAGTGDNQAFEAVAPISHRQLSNVSIANYFSIADHAGGTPLASIRPYYNYKCLDRAFEVIAEINVMVREWNTRREFDRRESDPTAHSAVGFEDAPFNTQPKNDFFDWKDFGNTYPDVQE